MPNDQTVKDARMLLEAFSTNHAEARMVGPYGLDRPFSPSWADAEQAGLDRARRDTAMRWLVEKNMLQSEEEPENPHGYRGGVLFQIRFGVQDHRCWAQVTGRGPGTKTGISAATE